MPFIPLQESKFEISVLASSFTAVLLPLKDVDAFPDVYASIKARFPKADHYPYAYRVRGKMKSSDDGEPGGAAGRPFLSLLERRDLEDCALIAIRYFGGSKLGLPRLCRTFQSAAEGAINEARLGEEVTMHRVQLTLSYHDYEEAKVFAKKRGFEIENTIFESSVTLTLVGGDTIALDLASWPSFKEGLVDLGECVYIKEINK